MALFKKISVWDETPKPHLLSQFNIISFLLMLATYSHEVAYFTPKLNMTGFLLPRYGFDTRLDIQTNKNVPIRSNRNNTNGMSHSLEHWCEFSKGYKHKCPVSLLLLQYPSVCQTWHSLAWPLPSSLSSLYIHHQRHV